MRKADTHSQHSALEIPARAQLLIDKVHAKSHEATTAKERKNISLAYASKAEALKDWPIYREHMKVAIRQSYEAREAAELESRAAEAKSYLDVLKRYLKFEDSVVHSAGVPRLCSQRIWPRLRSTGSKSTRGLSDNGKGF